MTRIHNLNMSTMDVIMKLSDGNVGATTTMLKILDEAVKIDPDDIMGALGTLLSLDTHEIYGTRILMLFNDVSKQNLSVMLGLLRAVQLGILSEAKLNTAINNYGGGININDILTKVQEQLPNFNFNFDKGKYDA